MARGDREMKIRKQKKQLKVIVSNGCGDCVFQNDGYMCNLDTNLKIEDSCFNKTRNSQCPLITNDIKVAEDETD
jgi:hypothetical protein